jgi:hypothetical protein
MSNSIHKIGELAQTNPGGATLYVGPSYNFLVPGGSILIVAGDSRQGFTPVQAPEATLGIDDLELPDHPTPEPLPTVMTVDGWAWEAYLHLLDNQAIVNTRYGINLRQKPDNNSRNLGVVAALCTVFILGDEENGYIPVRVQQADFVGANVSVRPLDKPIQSLTDLPEDIYLGWIRTSFLQLDGACAITRNSGTQLLNKPEETAVFMATVKGNATVSIAGLDQNNHMPVLVHKEQVFNVTTRWPEVEIPTPLPANQSPVLPPALSVNGTTPGWVLTSRILADNHAGEAGEQGVNLRDLPRRDGKLVGFIPAQGKFLVMGEPWGEFTPVRIDKDNLQPPVEDADLDPDPKPLGNARIGLHASADPAISEAEKNEFRLLRPGIVKILSFHNDRDIAQLAANHPDASWIVRAFLDFGNRSLTPAQFLEYTIKDVKRALNKLPGKEIVVELHNEPNIATEGHWKSWKNGAEFTKWWLELLDLYRKTLPDTRFIFPGLSPGSSVANVKVDHVQFIEACRPAVEAADGLGVHLYWSNVSPMSRSLEVLDDYINRFRGKEIWVTEASNNKAGTAPEQKARQYLDFWHALQQRPLVKGVTYFVASASNPEYGEEVWVGRGIGKLVGMR